MRRTKLLLLAPLLLALAGPLAWAQTQGRLKGRVTGPGGDPVDKAEVNIVSQRTASVQYDVKSDKDGRFVQIGLTPGYYRVTAKKDGFAPASKEIHIGIAEETTCELALKPVDPGTQKTLSKADQTFLAANKLYAEQKFAEAAASYTEAIGLDPSNWAFRFNLGLSLKKAGRSEEALAAFRQAVELNPESASANKETGEALAKAGQFAEARPFYEKAAALAPDDPDAQYNLGVCLVNIGEQEGALASFRKTVALKPDYADAFYQMASILISQNKVSEARDALEKFLALAPNHEKAGIARQLLDYLKK
jgi:Flp pilus assembly protein TadD